MAKTKKEWLDLPVYELTLKEDDDNTGVSVISLVDDPAMESMSVLLSKEQFIVKPGKTETEEEFIGRCIPIEINDGTAKDEKQAYAICKSKWDRKDEKLSIYEELSAVPEERIIYCPVLIPDKKVYRVNETTGDEYFIFFSGETIKECLRKFNHKNNNNNVSFMHKGIKVEGVVRESWIIHDPNCDKSTALGLNYPKNTWMSGIYIKDEKFWKNEVKKNDISKFSIEGEFDYTLVKLQNHLELTIERVIDNVIDNLTWETAMQFVEMIELATKTPRIVKRNSYKPNLHPNCKCIVENNVWKLGESESGPCQKCIDARDEFNKKKIKNR